MNMTKETNRSICISNKWTSRLWRNANLRRKRFETMRSRPLKLAKDNEHVPLELQGRLNMNDKCTFCSFW